MKKFFVIPLVAFLTLPVFAGGNWQAEEERIDLYEDSYLSEEEIESDRLEKEQRMEERDQNSSTIIESDTPRIDYDDRTRTDRARDALNTGGDASDDQ